jgi:hypothetical protein
MIAEQSSGHFTREAGEDIGSNYLYFFILDLRYTIYAAQGEADRFFSRGKRQRTGALQNASACVAPAAMVQAVGL